MPSGIQYQDNTGTTTQLTCNSPQDVCNIIANEWNNPFRNPRQVGYYHPSEKLDGLRKLIFNTVNLFGTNGYFTKDTQFTASRYEQDGTKVIQTMYNNDYMRSGVRVASIPTMVNGLPVGNRTVRAGFLVRLDRVDKTRFFLNKEMITMTMNDVTATQIPYNPVTNSVDLVLPESFGILASDDSECGCSPTCCGNGWRKLYVTDPVTHQEEQMWWRTQPPAGKGGTNPYGKVTVLGKTGYRVYAIRGVGTSATVNTTTLMPSDYGTPIILREGAVFRVGTTIPVSNTGCLPCGTPFREATTTQRIENGIEEMTGEIWCMNKHRLDTQSYFQDGMISEIQRAMVRVNNEIMNTLLYSQRGILAGTGNTLADGSTPYNGVGTESCNIIPNQTDGLMTIINKVATPLRIPIMEGCDNVCLISEIKELIEQLTGGALEGYILVGSDMLFEYIRTMINNRVNAVANPQVATEMLFGGTNTNYLYQENRGTIINGLGSGMQVDYKYLNIGGMSLPFFYDPELELRHPGRLYLLKMSAMEIWYPDGELERSWNYRTPSRIPGTLIPNIEVQGVEMTMMNGKMVPLAKNDCEYKFRYYLKAGAWYDMEAAPRTLIIDFYGVKDGQVVPVEEVACGCFRNKRQLYKTLQGI